MHAYTWYDTKSTPFMCTHSVGGYHLLKVYVVIALHTHFIHVFAFLFKHKTLKHSIRNVTVNSTSVLSFVCVPRAFNSYAYSVYTLYEWDLRIKESQRNCIGKGNHMRISLYECVGRLCFLWMNLKCSMIWICMVFYWKIHSFLCFFFQTCQWFLWIIFKPDRCVYIVCLYVFISC